MSGMCSLKCWMRFLCPHRLTSFLLVFRTTRGKCAHTLRGSTPHYLYAVSELTSTCANFTLSSVYSCTLSAPKVVARARWVAGWGKAAARRGRGTHGHQWLANVSILCVFNVLLCWVTCQLSRYQSNKWVISPTLLTLCKLRRLSVSVIQFDMQHTRRL